jgi:hypothetical protein
MTTMPKFNFGTIDVTDAEVEAAVAPRSNSKFFEPGNYTVKVTKAELGNANASDPTWYNVKLELGGIDERTIRTNLMIPTSDIRFNKPDTKNPLFLFAKLKEFLVGIGESGDTADVKKVLPKLFSKLDKLVGRELNVDIGYKGYYIGYVGQKQFKIFEKDGREFKDENGQSPVFVDRDSAIAEAATYGLTIAKFPEVLKITKKEISEDSDPWGE